MVHLRRSARFPWLPSSRSVVSRRYLIQDATISSPSIGGQSIASRDINSTKKVENRTAINHDEDYIRIPKSAIYIVIASATLSTLVYLVQRMLQNNEEAREKLFNAHSDDEWLAALKVARQRDIDSDFGRIPFRTMVRRTAEETVGKGEVLDHVDSPTGKERAFLGAAITGEVETRYLGKVRMYLSKEERESVPLSERWEEEKRQSYWDWQADRPNPVCVVM